MATSDHTPTSTEFKRCSACKKNKSLAEFHKDKSKKLGCSSTCKACAIERARKWYKNNADRVSEQNKQYYLEHKEHIVAHVKDRYWSDPEKARREGRNSYARNAEKRRAYNAKRRRERPYESTVYYRKWRHENRDIYRQRMRVAQQRRRARKRNAPDSFTEQDWIRALEYFDNCCAVCQRPLNGLFHRAAMDHWIPLSDPNSPGTIPTNIIPLCNVNDGNTTGACNQAKLNKNPQEWLYAKFGAYKAAKILSRIDRYFEWVRGLDGT